MSLISLNLSLQVIITCRKNDRIGAWATVLNLQLFWVYGDCFTFGGNMNRYKQPILTIMIIFATAYVLTLIGCAPAGGSSPAVAPAVDQPSDPSGPSDQVGTVELVDVNVKDMRECTNDEFSKLVSWSNALAASNAAIEASGGKQKSDVVRLALAAINMCDEQQYYHTLKPCKKTKQTIISTEVKGYDGYKINKRCQATENYLKKFDLRPNVAANSPALPQVPSAPTNPSLPPTSPINSGEISQLRDCSAEEFNGLKTFRTALEIANKNVDKLGAMSTWKYDQNAVDSSKSATLACESVIKYHSSQPCKRVIKNDATNQLETKTYSGETLRQQCAKARTYNYEFLQQSSSLITQNANLYLDTSVVSNMTIEPGYSSNKTIGQCIVNNESATAITYQGQKALVKAARVYPDPTAEGYQMFVLVTAEGLKLECYGLDYVSLKSSKSEVVRLLKAKNTNINLSYELN